jgi:hypothetical protein
VLNSTAQKEIAEIPQQAFALKSQRQSLVDSTMKVTEQKLKMLWHISRNGTAQ